MLQILSFLDTEDIVHIQYLSHRYLVVGRDNALWKIRTFDDSRAEALRRRQKLISAQDERLSELRNAVSALPGTDLTAWDVSQLRGSGQPRASSDPDNAAKSQRQRALANWEPGYPGERLDYYEEYIHRHAPINMGWLERPCVNDGDRENALEATGVGTLMDVESGRVNHVVAPLEDGSVCIWDTFALSGTSIQGAGRLAGRSRSGLLTGTSGEHAHQDRAIMTETGAVECVAIDSESRRGYFAVQNNLHEIDLTTLQTISTKQYPWPITALSEVKDNVPVTVGTNLTIHLHDPRDSAFGASEHFAGGELIGGSMYSHATLTQPGPLSILHHDDFNTDSSIWVAGRFTSLLNYDRRFFPRLRGTIHSGARIASLEKLPYPLVPQSLNLVRNPEASLSSLTAARTKPGTTILAAAEYKGKGSLELYGLPCVQPYQNRQTASASKLLSVAPHGGRIVFSDGDGNLKWVERDGFSHVRTCNINDFPSSNNKASEDATPYGIWPSTASELPGQGDIIQKIIPTRPVASSSSPARQTDFNQSHLLLWTSSGALGVLGFGPTKPLHDSRHNDNEEHWHDAVEDQAREVEVRAREDAERQYGLAMRRALERNADEVRFVRGLGMGYGR